MSTTVATGSALTRRNLATLCLLLVSACAIARELSPIPWFSPVAGIALLVFVLLQWSGISLTYRIFAIVAPGLAAGLWFSAKIDSAALAAGLDRAAFFTFFLTSLAVLRESAKTSSLVRSCGKVLVNQPPGRRYLLMAFGSHLFSVMLNIGALNVLGTMVRRAVRPSSDLEALRIGTIRRKRMLTATIRGFCGVPLWAPTSVTMLLVLSGIPDLSWEQYAPLGLFWTLLFILWGAVLDRFAYQRPKVQSVNGGGLVQLIPLVALVALIPGLAFVLSRITGLQLFSTLLMCAPAIGLIWIWVQYRGKPIGIKTGLMLRRMRRSFPETFTSQRNEVVLFTSSGFIGVILIPLIDPAAASAFLTQANISNATLMVCISLIMLTFSFIGINAIITVTLMLGALQQLPELNIHPLIQASVIAITWAVFAGASPFTASLRFISSFSGISPLRFGLEWNGGFSASVLAIMYLTLYLVL
ncbi:MULTISPECIES: hypothetical protein [Pseudomonas]|uniref:hypothetical protein n=1 Tax=Pseudomonas TaxID=286 RepID=UPI00117E14D5|nr:hypothetical protein [Pseudomonas alloputida]